MRCKKCPIVKMCPRISAIGSPNMPTENWSSVALRRLLVMKLSSIKSNAAIPSNQSTGFWDCRIDPIIAILGKKQNRGVVPG